MALHYISRSEYLSVFGEHDDYYYTVNGRLLCHPDDLPEDSSVIQVHGRLRGGKGGFGSMLRAIGNQIEKTTNNDMCRDLSGRRMRDVNAEEKLKEWYSSAGERERARLDRYLEKQKRRREALKKGPLHDHKFDDPEFSRRKQHISNQLQDAVEAALEGIKTNFSTSEPVKKKARLWIECMDEGSISSSDDDSRSQTSSSSCEDEKDQPTTSDMCFNKSQEISASGCEEKSSDEIPQKSPTETIQIVTSETQKVTNITQVTDQILNASKSSEDLELFGMECLKEALITRGLKCGGTLAERAARLFLVKGLTAQEYPLKLLAKTKNK